MALQMEQQVHQEQQAQPLFRCVVRHTFLELEEDIEQQEAAHRQERRAKTDSALTAQQKYEKYELGRAAPASDDETDLGSEEAEETADEEEVVTPVRVQPVAAVATASAAPAAKTPSGIKKQVTFSLKTEEIEPVWSTVEPAAPKQTTVMLRNLPNNYTREMLLKAVDREGFAGCYDFFYLAMDFRTRANVGYAFINFVDEASVARFWKVFEGFRNWVLPTNKRSHVSWSQPHQQGLAVNLDRYRNSSVMHPNVPDNFKPLYFVNGLRVPFPEATRPLQEPLMRN